MPSENGYMILCENLVKIYKTTDIEVIALQGLDLIVKAGELMAIIGNSGSGKSTLLNIIGGLDKPSAGKIEVDGRDLLKYSDKDLMQYRRDTIGFVWQNSARNLIPYLCARDNVEVPMFLSRKSNARKRAGELLELVGLKERMKSRLEELSGGEQQRVAIAISMANEPSILLADEPTGNVDSKTANNIFQAFREINKNLGVTIVIVTHDRRISRAVDRVVAIRDGRTSSEFIRKTSYAEELASLADIRSEEETHDELAVLDKVGRLQIPGEYLEAIGLSGKNKIRIELEEGRIVLMPPEEEKEKDETEGEGAV